jgi:hypothetical protein
MNEANRQKANITLPGIVPVGLILVLVNT